MTPRIKRSFILLSSFVPYVCMVMFALQRSVELRYSIQSRWQMADGRWLRSILQYNHILRHHPMLSPTFHLILDVIQNPHHFTSHFEREWEWECEYHSAWVESARCIPRGHNPSLFIMIDKFIFLILVFIYTITNQFIYQRNAEGGFRFLTIIKI